MLVPKLRAHPKHQQTAIAGHGRSYAVLFSRRIDSLRQLCGIGNTHPTSLRSLYCLLRSSFLAIPNKLRRWSPLCGCCAASCHRTLRQALLSGNEVLPLQAATPPRAQPAKPRQPTQSTEGAPRLDAAETLAGACVAQPAVRDEKLAQYSWFARSRRCALLISRSHGDSKSAFQSLADDTHASPRNHNIVTLAFRLMTIGYPRAAS